MVSATDFSKSEDLRQRRRKLTINDLPLVKPLDDLASEVEENLCTKSDSSLKTLPVCLSHATNEASTSAQVINFFQPLRTILSNDQTTLQNSEYQPLLIEKQQVSPTYSQFEDDAIFRPKKLGILEFVGIELTRGYSLHQEEDRYTEKRRKVYAFVRIPFELEKFLFYGFLQCLDSFCHIFTFLPIRIFLSVFGYISRFKDWTAADTCDVLKIVIIVVASWFMQAIDTSALYHIVRGQGVIKLYIFYNMLEVLDKLLSSFGQDILDALLWTASERGSKQRKFFMTILHLAFAIGYALGHAILVLLQATTLNVAFFNIHNNSLLTIMMSNNFVELKGSVFKKFGKPNLFQMSCSDVRERFYTVVLLIVVVMRIMTAVNWDFDHLYEMLPDLAIVIIAEFIVDWLKHAFITKFNEMSPEVYQDFTITLAFDVVRSHEKSSFSDFSDQVSRRMGFIPIPLSIMLIRVIYQSIDFRTNLYVIVFFFLALVWLALLATKVLAGVFLHSRAVDQVIHYRSLQMQAKNELYRRRILLQKSKSAPGSPRLSLVDFSDVLTQATTAPKTMTASDMLAHWDEMVMVRRREPSDSKCVNVDVPSDVPRRCQSMVDFSDKALQCLEHSSQPSIPEGEERCCINDENASLTVTAESQSPQLSGVAPQPFRLDDSVRAQSSPKRRIPTMECESLSDVQAYTLLNGAEPVEQFPT